MHGKCTATHMNRGATRWIRGSCGICWYPDRLRASLRGGNLVPVIVPVRLACRVLRFKLRLRFHDDMAYCTVT